MTPVLVVFALVWLLALLWLVLMARLLRCLLQSDPSLYDQLDRPMMRWLWWSWPEPREGLPPYVNVLGLAQGRLELRGVYSVKELGAAARLGRWIVLNRPRASSSAKARRLQRQLRLCGAAFVLGFCSVVVMAIWAAQA